MEGSKKWMVQMMGNNDADNSGINKKTLWEKAGTDEPITRGDLGIPEPQDNSGMQALNEGYLGNSVDANLIKMTETEYKKKCLKRAEQNGKNEYNQQLSQEDLDRLSLCVESARLEYEHSFRRAERLDNKICILLTVCAFIIVLLTGTINRVSEIEIFNFCQSGLVAAYDIVLILSILLTLASLIILIKSLSGKDFKRYDTGKILEKNLLSEYDGKTIARYTIMKYEKARNYNNDVVSKQFKWLNLSVHMLIAVVILLMTFTLMGNFVFAKNERGSENNRIDNSVTIEATSNELENGGEIEITEH